MKDVAGSRETRPPADVCGAQRSDATTSIGADVADGTGALLLDTATAGFQTSPTSVPRKGPITSADIAGTDELTRELTL